MHKPLLFTSKLFIFTIASLLFNSAQAIEISLEDWVFNIDGVISEDFAGDPLPATGVLVDGLGALSLEITSSGSHNIIGYFDFEIFESFNTFFNESGMETGIPAIGQSWEIDEPGFIYGDIVDNVFLGALDNSNGVPAGAEDDVGFSIGWNFSLLPGDIATIDFIFSDTLPAVDFFLTQTDPDLNQSLYFYSSLDIQTDGLPPGPSVIPLPPTIYLMISGLLGLLISQKRSVKYK